MKISLKALRVNANLSQQESADILGVTVRTIQNWESRVTFPTAMQLVRICQAYNCTLDDIDIFLPNALAKSEDKEVTNDTI